MKLRLKETPLEWTKFVAVIGILFGAITTLLWHKGILPVAAFRVLTLAYANAVFFSLIKPRWFRGFYRQGMTITNKVGHVMGTVLLTLFFLGFVSPFAMLLRLTGKDFLTMKPQSHSKTYWVKSKSSRHFDRMF